MDNKDDRFIDVFATSLKNMMMNKSYEETVKPLKEFAENHNTKRKAGVNMTREELDFIQPKKVVGKLISVDVLDKIRAEIENMEIVYDKSANYKDERTDEEKANSWGKMYKVLVLSIIDKYKAESEVSNELRNGKM